MPAYVHLLVAVRALVEQLGAAQVAVEPAGLAARVSVAAGVACRELVVELAGYHIGTSAAGGIAVGATLKVDIGTGLLLRARHDVDCAHKGRRAVDAPCRSFEDFDAFNLRYVYREIGRVVACLRIADVDTVKKYGDLFVGASTDADVCLCTHRATLPDIDAGGVL